MGRLVAAERFGNAVADPLFNVSPASARSSTGLVTPFLTRIRRMTHKYIDGQVRL
jgi:hypothetical protein